MAFQHIEYLLALFGIPAMAVLYFIYVKWKKQTIKKIGDPVLVQQLISDYSPQKFFLKFGLIIFLYNIDNH